MKVPRTDSLRATDAAWRHLDQEGWDGGQRHLSALYPMPGDERFDQDELFERIPIFPGVDGKVVRAGDYVWRLPSVWFRELEVRPESHALINYNLMVGGRIRLKSLAGGKTLITLLQKVMYLEAFRTRRPLAISTLRRRLDIYGAFARVAATVGKPVALLTYPDLGQAVAAINESGRTSLPSAYETLRWWKSQEGASFAFFDPPPSPEAVMATGLSDGFDPQNLRADDAIVSEASWQPLPDAFIAAAGGISITLVEVVRPVLLECLGELAEHRAQRGEAASDEDVLKVIDRHQWPDGFRPRTSAEFRHRCRQAQTATIFLLSLLLGARSSEILSLPRHQVIQTVVDGQAMHFLEGTTFKLSRNYSGDNRDWPIHDLLSQALRQQESYIDFTEGSEFKYLWKQHVSLFGAGACLRDIDSQLQDFIQQFSLDPFLGGTRCHHHRFRKTTARLIVIALYGGPVVLRRLFGHQHLAMTLRYILANASIIDDLKEIAQEEQRAVAQKYAERSREILGKGGDTFRQALATATEILKVTVPEGRREQTEFKAAELVEFLSDGPEGLTIKQIIPGLLACFKPRDAAGECCSINELPNIAKCSAECKWQMMLPEFEEHASANIEDALQHVEADPNNPLTNSHYRGVITYWSERFPSLRTAFSTREAYARIMRLIE